MNTTNSCAKSFYKRTDLGLVSHKFSQRRWQLTKAEKKWMERNGIVNVVDKGDRAGIYKVSLGPDKI